MSDKVKSIDQLEVVKPSKLSPKPVKHTNCQSIPSTLMSFGYNQAAAAAASNCNATHTEGKHHHHHHHHHGHNHHQPHVIYRTTSESLRIGSDLNHAESTHSLSNSTSMSSSGTSSSGGNQQLLLSMTRKPKTSSFQITSVTVGNKLSADNGDDSADDLDESHTDDNSRITDMENETPSFSEDTFSKEDVFFSNSALGTAPVIPTSSQYGLVIVDPDLGGVGGQSGQNLSNVHVSMADAGINIVGAPSSKLGDSDQKDMLHRNERFKVVKIESTEPFKRGRWMCMDYLDHSTLGSDAAANASTNNAQSSGQGGVTNDSGVVILENNSEVSCEPSETGSLYNAGISSIISSNNHSPGQTLQKPLGEQQSQSLVNNIVNVPSGMIPHSTASMSHQVSVSASQANMVCPPYTQPNQMHQSLPPQQQYQQPASHMPGQSQPAHFYQNNQPNPSAVPTMHGVTLPSNINMQNGVPTNFVPQQQQVQQQTQPQQPPQQVTAPQSMPAVNIAMNAPTNCTDQNNVNIVTSMPPTSNMVQATSISQPASMAQVIPQTQQQPECYLPQSSQSYAGPGMPVTSSASGGIPMDIHHPDMSAAVQQQQQQHQQLLSQQQPQQQAQSLPAQQHQQQQPPSVVGSMSVAANATPQNISPAGVETMMQQQPQPTNQSPLQNMAIGQDGVVQQSIATVVNDGSSTVSTPQQAQASSATGTQQQATAIGNEEDQAAALEADSESASGTSAVAIDNKIEQAMDLVKSHLMIAVREEVEVLKEKIAELMDRINQLELENTILKANVSQETLSQLSATMQSAAAKPPTNQNTSNGPIS